MKKIGRGCRCNTLKQQTPFPRLLFVSETTTNKNLILSSREIPRERSRQPFGTNAVLATGNLWCKVYSGSVPCATHTTHFKNAFWKLNGSRRKNNRPLTRISKFRKSLHAKPLLKLPPRAHGESLRTFRCLERTEALTKTALWKDHFFVAR